MILYCKKCILPVNADLRWLNEVSCFFLTFLLITIHKWIIIAYLKNRIGLLAACIAQRVVGAALVVFLLRWRLGVRFAQSSSEWEARDDT